MCMPPYFTLMPPYLTCTAFPPSISQQQLPPHVSHARGVAAMTGSKTQAKPARPCQPANCLAHQLVTKPQLAWQAGSLPPTGCGGGFPTGMLLPPLPPLPLSPTRAVPPTIPRPCPQGRSLSSSLTPAAPAPLSPPPAASRRLLPCPSTPLCSSACRPRACTCAAAASPRVRVRAHHWMCLLQKLSGWRRVYHFESSL